MCRCDAARVLTPRVHNENRDEKLGVMCCPAVDAPCACERHGRSDACASAAEESAAVAAAAPARAGVGILLCELSRLIVDTVVREPAGGTVGADRSTDGLDHAQHSSSRIPQDRNRRRRFAASSCYHSALAHAWAERSLPTDRIEVSGAKACAVRSTADQLL